MATNCKSAVDLSPASCRSGMRIQKISLTKVINATLDKEHDELSREYIDLTVSQALDKLEVLKSSQQQLYQVLNNLELDEETKDHELQQQMDIDVAYNDKVLVGIAKIKSLVSKIETQPNVIASAVPSVCESAVPGPAQTALPVRLKLPEIKIGVFNDNSSDPFNFFRFKSSFHNALDSFEDTPNCVKLVYLKSYLRGRALSMIENLPITDDNLELAWDMLEEEFMDVDLLINDTLSEIISWKVCTTLNECQHFITNLKVKLVELQKLNLDFFTDDSSGAVLISHIIRTKLYIPFLQELCRKLSNNYPTAKDILDNYSSIYELMNSRESKKAKDKVKYVTEASDRVQLSSDPKHGFSSNSNVKGCKFCSLINHSSLHCKRFSNYDEGVKRAKELKLCTRCLSAKHLENDCPGKSGNLPYQCKSCYTATHVTPLCANMVLSLSAAKTVTSRGARK